MDKTDKPKSVREVLLAKFDDHYWDSFTQDKTLIRKHFEFIIHQALTDIYSLLVSGVEDKVCSTPVISPAEYVTHDMALDACEPEMEGRVYKGETAEQCGGCIECIQAQANALWRKHLQERLR